MSTALLNGRRVIILNEKKGKYMYKKYEKAVIPPLLYLLIKKIVIRKTKPSWNTITDGILKGREFYFDRSLHKDFLDGTYDKYFWDYIASLDLKGKTVYEIGGHIGYHAMNFAELVGSMGSVYAFEPNPFNRENKYFRCGCVKCKWRDRVQF